MKVSVLYEHDPANLHDIYLAVFEENRKIGEDRPKLHHWYPAYRDTDEHGRKVVWVRTDLQFVSDVWLKDSEHVERVPQSKRV